MVLMKERILKKSYYRNAEEYESYFLSIDTSFDDFCKSLGKNTRLKLLNRRKILEKMGVVKYIEMDNEDIESHFKLLNSLHTKRWGIPVFEGDRLKFNNTVATLMAKNASVQFSVIKLDNESISIQYNYVIDKHVYNIQAGFNENFHNKISLGYLHFGYAIESAYKTGMKYYDFLAGEGKNTQYKSRLTDSSHTITSMQIIRSKYAKSLYYTYDLYKKLMKTNI